MECTTTPGRDNSSTIRGLCWIDENTLIGVQHYGWLVLKFTIDTETKACLTEVIEEVSYYQLYDISCSRGEIFVSHDGLVRIYNVKTGQLEPWKTQNTNRVSVNDDLIVLGGLSTSSVYDRTTRDYMYTLDNGGVKGVLESNYLTSNNFYWATMYSNPRKLILVDLKNNRTSTGKREVNYPKWVSGVPGDSVFVTSVGGGQVGVFTEKGDYLNDLKIEKPTKGSLGPSAGFRRQGKDDLIAFAIEYSATDPVKIYTLQP